MTIRMTQGMTSSVILSDIQNASARLGQLSQKLSSGKELTSPADDPYGVTRAMQLRNDLAANQQYQRNVTDANSWHSVHGLHTLEHLGLRAARPRSAGAGVD